ncbi:hypothetical protein QYF61_005749 [Mycteria americana]|uniref:Uncharacterized protein n=1 Tax=Mycteria americana TaxID=33587 RepID=A0AAN7S610_MYCAM|nr:hypothetical protein QYF61_005749 [Mycteria americana]
MREFKRSNPRRAQSCLGDRQDELAKSRSFSDQTNRTTKTFYAEHDAIWYGIALWSAGVSCPSRVPSQLPVPPQPPRWWGGAKQPQLPQPLLIRLVLQTLHQLRCPSLDTLQHLNVSLVVGGPKLNTVFKVQSHQCRVQGHNHFRSPAGHTIPDTSQDAIGLLGHLGTLLAHIQAAVNQHPQVLLCQAAFQPLFPKPVALHGVAVTQVQDPHLALLNLIQLASAH